MNTSTRTRPTLDTDRGGPRSAYTEAGHPRPGMGVGALGCAAAAMLLLPLVVIPGVSLLPPLLAAVGVILGIRGIHDPRVARGWVVAGLVAAACALVITGFASLMWMAYVVDPAIGQYPELHEAVQRIFAD